MNVPDTTKAVQRWLGLRVDGIAGPKTWNAIAQAIGMPVAVSNGEVRREIAPKQFDARTEANIGTLVAPVQSLARELLVRLNAEFAPCTAKIVSGLRTYEEQDALYAKGRSVPGAIITNARAGYSNHNFGIAFDIGFFDASGKYLEGNDGRSREDLYALAGVAGKSLGFNWGGDWASINDESHFEWHPTWAAHLTENAMLAELRLRKAKGQAIA